MFYFFIFFKFYKLFFVSCSMWWRFSWLTEKTYNINDIFSYTQWRAVTTRRILYHHPFFQTIRPLSSLDDLVLPRLPDRGLPNICFHGLDCQGAGWGWDRLVVMAGTRGAGCHGWDCQGTGCHIWECQGLVVLDGIVRVCFSRLGLLKYNTFF